MFVIQFKPLNTEFHFRSPSKATDTLYDPYFHFCYELALETCSSIKPLTWVHDLCHAHLSGNLHWSVLFAWPVNASPYWKHATVAEWSHYKARRTFSMPVCVKGEKWLSQCRSRLIYRQPRHFVLKTTHLPLYPTFLASANPSSKWVAPTDNMRHCMKSTLITRLT